MTKSNNSKKYDKICYSIYSFLIHFAFSNISLTHISKRNELMSFYYWYPSNGVTCQVI